jgi:glucuronoarabinoxylan endo-1,4-beta-xylanase
VTAGVSGCLQRNQDSPAATSRLDREQPSLVTVVPSTRFQTLEGFGAAVAWYQDRLVGNTPEGLYELLFPELGLDMLRFRNRYRRSKPKDDELRHELEILTRATRALGRAPKLMLTSWSPPAVLKANGKEDCQSNADCTLTREGGRFVYDKFAAYWRDSLVHYASLGIVPDYVSIQNEPSFLPPSWEGCKFTPSETREYPGYDRALEKVAEQLKTLSSAPKLLGPEAFGIHWNGVQNYLEPLDLALLHGISHHLYEKGNDPVWDWRSPGPDSFADEMRAVRALTNKPLFQTEFHTDEDGGVEGGFETLWLIHHSLVEEQVVAFLYWDLIWVDDKGLVSLNGRSYRARDQYYSVKHYARFTDPGYVRVEARSESGEIRVSAFLAPQGERLTAVLLNTGKVPRRVRIDPGDFQMASADAYRTIYRPGNSDAWKRISASTSALEVSLPPRSAATVVLAR